MFSESPEKQRDSEAWQLTRWWHWAIGVVLVVLFTLLTPREKSPEFARLSEGSISQAKIIAPFDFEVMKPPDEIEAERREAADKILPLVFRNDSAGITTRLQIQRLSREIYTTLASFPDSYFGSLEDTSIKPNAEDWAVIKLGYERFNDKFGFKLTEQTWRVLAKLYHYNLNKTPVAYNNLFATSLDWIIRDVYSQGILDVPRETLTHSSGQIIVQLEGVETPVELSTFLTITEALDRITKYLSQQDAGNGFTPETGSAIMEITQAFISPNISYREAETKARREAVVRKVATAVGVVKKDELIIDKNIRVTAEHLVKLRSLAIKYREMEIEKGGFSLILPHLATMALFGLIICLLWIYIALTHLHIWREWKHLVLIAIVFSLVQVFLALVPVSIGVSRFLFPAALLAMLLGILIDRSLALMAVVAMAMVSGLLKGNDYPTAITALAVGCSSILAVRYVKTRGDVMAVTAYLGVTYALLVPALHFGRFTSDSTLWTDFLVAGANAFLSPVLVLGFIHIFENLFRITTDLTLLELVDLNRPLLRELAIKSPGTYHHSIMVGSLAESAARAIGANALLTRAGAYYHDIGKIENKEYFIENQEVGTENVHDKLPPSRSAMMVIKHVTSGLELADKHRLPEQIKAFISEHHGKTRLAYFYAKAVRELGEDVDEYRFRYPGPNPQSKETGILMLADIVEAATRSLESKSVEDLEKTVQKLVKSRLSEGDLDECPLTLKEVALIEKAFVQALTGIYHQRIAYPGQISGKNTDSEPPNPIYDKEKIRSESEKTSDENRL